jgi:hypothetical protein
MHRRAHTSHTFSFVFFIYYVIFTKFNQSIIMGRQLLRDRLQKMSPQLERNGTTRKIMHELPVSLHSSYLVVHPSPANGFITEYAIGTSHIGFRSEFGGVGQGTQNRTY